MQINRGLTMNEENKHGYWIHKKIEDSTSVTGCPNCGAHMDKEN